MKNRIYYLLLVILMLGTLCACHKGGNQDAEAEDGEIVLYYLNADENGLTKVAKKLDLPSDPSMAITEVMETLKTVEKEDGFDYHALLNEELSYNDIQVNENGNASIDFGAGYEQLDASKEILIRAAIVRSLHQIEGVNTVEFTINGVPLADKNGIYVGTMDSDTFIMDTDKKAVYDYVETVELYMADWDGESLVPVEVDIKTKNNQSIEEAALEALKYPHGEGTKSPIPDNVIFNHVNVIQGICYVDLSEEIIDSQQGISDEVKIYSMVNTLTSLERATQVQFTINGEVVKTMNEMKDFDLPMSHDVTLETDGLNY